MSPIYSICYTDWVEVADSVAVPVSDSGAKSTPFRSEDSSDCGGASCPAAGDHSDAIVFLVSCTPCDSDKEGSLGCPEFYAP